MKFWFLKIGFFLSFFVSAQQPYFDKYFNVGYNTLATQNMIMLYDSTYLIHNIVKDSATGRQDCGLLKIDRWGNEQVKKTINFQNVMYLRQESVYNNLIQISPSSVLLFGVNYYNTSTVNNIFCKINTATLDTVFCKYYSDNFHYYAYNCLKLHENKYLLVGTKGTSVSSWPNIMEIDTNLNILNSYDVTSYTGSITVTDAKINPDNKRILLSGYKMLSINEVIYSYTRLLEVDTIGNVYNTYFDNDGLGTGYSQVFYSHFDSTYVSVGAKKTSDWYNYGLYRLYVCKFNATTLFPIWKKTYYTAQLYNGLFDAVVNVDGSIISSGCFADSVVANFNISSSANRNGVMLKVSAAGDVLWMREYDNFQNHPMQMYDEMFKGIEKTNDGGYIACGMPFYKPQGEAWVIRVDSMGCFNAACTPLNMGVQENEQNSIGFVIYPNPAKEKLFVKIEEGLKQGKLTIRIFDLAGRLLIDEDTSLEKDFININGLTSGVYFCKIFTENKAVKNYKIIVE